MKMYLLFEWTEERESKLHIGIFSKVEKAQAVANLSWVKTCEDEATFVGLRWEKDTNGMVGFKNTGGSYEDDYPYSIEGFEVDVYTDYKYGPGTENPTIVRHEL